MPKALLPWMSEVLPRVSRILLRKPSEVFLPRVPKFFRRITEVLRGMSKVFWRVPIKLPEISLGMLEIVQLPQIILLMSKVFGRVN